VTKDEYVHEYAYEYVDANPFVHVLVRVRVHVLVCESLPTLHRQQPIKERTVSLQREPQILR
jgi:hypothetical protein